MCQMDYYEKIDLLRVTIGTNVSNRLLLRVTIGTNVSNRLLLLESYYWNKCVK